MDEKSIKLGSLASQPLAHGERVWYTSLSGFVQLTQQMLFARDKDKYVRTVIRKQGYIINHALRRAARSMSSTADVSTVRDQGGASWTFWIWRLDKRLLRVDGLWVSSTLRASNWKL